MRNRCIKCLGPLAADEFVVNHDMAYCGDCACLLHLGESKESRIFRALRGIEGETPESGELVPVAASVEGAGADSDPA